MRILATNDDGVYAEGLWASVAQLREVGEVTVVAPDREQSGVGTAITLNEPLRAMEIKPIVEGVKTYAVEGTPADCTILALETLLDEKVDLVVSGINRGANLGNDMLISGTMGAAFQGFFRDIPAFALSVAALKDVHYQTAALVGKMLAQAVERRDLESPLLLNVNVPNQPMDKIKGISLTKIGRRTYMDVVKEDDDGRRKYYWITRDKPGWVMEKGLDIWAIRRKRVSITPIHSDLINSVKNKAVNKAIRGVRNAVLGR